MQRAIDVLLVEDSATDLELAMRALERYHMVKQIHSVRDGEQTLDFIFAKGAYSNRTVGTGIGLILLDLHMPRVDGFEVLRALVFDPRASHIPVIVLTSSNHGPDVTESMRLGAKGYMVKPVDFHKLVETARQLGFHWSLLAGQPVTATG
ncbi:MAG: response regulator [Betaproteobacteria bacterium]